MTERKPEAWNRLDNAGKIFPPTSTKRDTKVFRFACELTEPVNATILQTALDRTLEVFPFYRSILKKGLFWYYLERTSLEAVVHEENASPCSKIYDKNIRSLLFEVTYYRNRINLEIYHALSDGTGALQFLRLLVYHYLLMRHADFFGEQLPTIDYDASMTQKLDDSFQKYYQKNSSSLGQKKRRAYHIKGARVPESRIQIIEGIVPVKGLITRSHEYGATLTAFVAALLMCSISEVMSVRDKRRPVVLTVPVNMRQYFPSETARNFFTTLEVPYDFGRDSGELADVVKSVSDYFRQELTAERMGIRMNSLAALEHNVFARAVPRVVKDFFLRIGNSMSNSKITAALSNIGRIDMPQVFHRYIHRFDVFVSTPRLQICMCSFGENLTVSFTSAFVSTEIQKVFFRKLTALGVPVTIVSNPIEEE